jgi:heme-degrading monooxygenase HmoA
MANRTLLVRSWSARATPEGAAAYRRHFETDLLPSLAAIPGHEGVLLLARSGGAGEELEVLSFWKSMDAMRAFAGTSVTTAVVAPEARAALSDYDREVRIYEVLVDTRTARP